MMMPEDLPHDLSTTAKLFRGLGDPSRLFILLAMKGPPKNVGEIVAETGLSQSNVSNHLACLLDCGLVVREREGRFAYYSLSDRMVGELLDTAENLVAHVARGVEGCLRYQSAAR